MKKINKILFIVLLLFIFIFKVDATEKVLLENNESFGEIINNHNVSDKLLLKNNNSLEELDLKTKVRRVVHEFNTSSNETFMVLNKNIIYFYYTDSENTKVIKYDISTGSESEVIVLDTKSHFNDVKKLTNLKVDSNGIMYFNYSNNGFVSFSSTGEFIDSYDTGLNNYLMISGISYDNDKLYICLPLNSSIENTDAFIYIENGKFSDKQLYGSYDFRGVIYTSDGAYAINNMNYIYRVNDKKLEFITNTSFIRSADASVKLNNDYMYIEGNDIYYRFNIGSESLDKVYKLNYDFSGINYLSFVVIDDEINVLVYDNNHNYYLLKLDSQDIKHIVVDSHKTMNYTVEEIKAKYKNSLPTFNYKNSIYEKNPSYKSGKYVTGKLKSGVVRDTLNQLNFYRWLYGINEVSINEEFMARSMAGAIIQKKLGKITHTPSKPKDMSESFYKLAYAGVNAGNDYSGNVSFGTKVYNIALNYILDVSNVQTNVGHRLSMLDIKSNKTSFGYLDTYSAMSMYTTNEDLGNNEIFYSWPNAGYFPVNNIDTNMFWSVLLNDGYTFTNNFKVTLYDSDNKEYKVTGYGLNKSDMFFQLPSSLVKKIVNNKKFIIGEEVKVKVSGIIDKEYNEYELNYPVHFINAKTGQYEKITLVTPKIEVKKNSDYSVDVTITNYNEKQKYTLEKSTDNKKWTKVGVFESDKINVKGFTFGKKTYLRVKMTIYDYKKYSSVSNITIKPNKVNLKINSASTNNIKLSWDRVTTSGYEVYRSLDNKKWSKITTITKNNTLSFNNKKLKENKTYYYKVRAYKTVSGKKVYGPFSSVVNTKTAPLKPSVTLSIKEYNELSLKINSSKGASKYIIEKSIDNTNYELLSEINGSQVLSETNTELGKTYYYRVKACNSTNRCSGWVYVNKTQTTKTPSFTLKTTSKHISVNVNEVLMSNGYQVYMSTSKKGKYKLLKEFNSEEELVLNISTKKGSKYYFKVRSFSKTGDKMVYSSFSKIKSIKSK